MFLGQVLGGQYRIERQIGEGGFGTIYLARNLQLDREVAIKALRNQKSPFLPDLVQRFEREVSLARKLEHPNIVRLYDHGRLDDGTLFMVMEYVRGVELEEVLRTEYRVSADRATKIIVQILDALAEAHDMGIVHRDLKPSNVMLTRSGLRGDVVKLLDFGIAKAFDGTYEDLTAQNLSQGVGFGTPQYMAPEQINGRDIGPHTDLYATGLIYIELMTGMPLMLGKHPADTIRRQLEEEVPISEFVRRLPMGAVLERALCKDWRRRYQSAAEMYADLERDVLPLLATELAGLMLPDEALDVEVPSSKSMPVTVAQRAAPASAPNVAAAQAQTGVNESRLNESRPAASESGPTVIVSEPNMEDALAYAQQEGWVGKEESSDTFTDRSVPLTVDRRLIDQQTVPTLTSPPPLMMSQPVRYAATASPVVPAVAYVLGGFAVVLLVVLLVLLLTL